MNEIVTQLPVVWDGQYSNNELANNLIGLKYNSEKLAWRGRSQGNYDRYHATKRQYLRHVVETRSKS